MKGLKALATLFLLRHARASWPQPGGRDFDRALQQSGLDDAVNLGIRMAAQGLFPAAAICSTAIRARETLRELIVGMDASFPIDHDDRLYEVDASGYLEIIRKAGGEGPLLVVGHNPMMEDIANMLVDIADLGTRRQLLDGFPVCGLAVIDFTTPLEAVEPSKGNLRAFLKSGDA